jgi:transposase-like protein
MLVVDAGRGVRDVARELDGNYETLRNCVSALKRERAAPSGPVSGDERAELAWLRRRVAELELENVILKRSAVIFVRRRGGEPKRDLRSHRRGEGQLRRAPSLPSAGRIEDRVYDWSARGDGPTAAALEEAYAIHVAHQAWIEHRGVYGARRLTAEIRSRRLRWNRRRVARLMRIGGIEGVHRRRRG